jgi:tRNA (adenine37-N6)-methyltransferase
MMENNIRINPVGEVIQDVKQPLDMPIIGKLGMIKIYRQYVPALFKITDNSHLWILSWFHEAERDMLKVAPKRLNKSLPERGIFGLRTFNRPNPIGLSLVEFIKVEDDSLYVAGLDAIGGTPVLDIKPYFEQDIIFSPRTPYIRAEDPVLRSEMFKKEALAQHREDCIWLKIGVRIAMIADEHLGKLQSPDIRVKVMGPGCLADVIQGLTRARFANPPRLECESNKKEVETIWKKEEKKLAVKLRNTDLSSNLEELKDNELFDIQFN